MATTDHVSVRERSARHGLLPNGFFRGETAHKDVCRGRVVLDLSALRLMLRRLAVFPRQGQRAPFATRFRRIIP